MLLTFLNGISMNIKDSKYAKLPHTNGHDSQAEKSQKLLTDLLTSEVWSGAKKLKIL